MQVESTEHIPMFDRIFAVFKGEPGSGKSIAAASFPRPIIIDFDGRIKSIANFYNPRGKRIDFIRPSAVDFINITDAWIRRCDYKTIVVDSLTRIAGNLINTMIDTRTKGTQKKGVQRGGLDVAQIEDYGGEARGLTMILENLQAISLTQGVNVILIAHVIRTQDTDLKTKLVTEHRALMTGGKKVAAAVPTYFDEAYHFHSRAEMDGTVSYFAMTQSTGTDWAKTTLPLPARIDFKDQMFYDILVGLVGEPTPALDDSQSIESQQAPAFTFNPTN